MNTLSALLFTLLLSIAAAEGTCANGDGRSCANGDGDVDVLLQSSVRTRLKELLGKDDGVGEESTEDDSTAEVDEVLDAEAAQEESEDEDKDAEGAAEDTAAGAEEAEDLAASACKWHIQAAHDGIRCEFFAQGVFFFLGANSTYGIHPNLSGVQASLDEDAAKKFVESQIEPFVEMQGIKLYATADNPGSNWRTVVKPESLPKLTARIELLQHMYAARHAWVALSALDGDEAARQRRHLKRLYSRTSLSANIQVQHLTGDFENPIHPFALADEEAIVQKRLELAQDLRNALISPALLQLLEVAKSCFLPRDHHLFGHNSQLSQRSRVRPVGPLTKDSFILLSEPDGSITEKDDLKMPMMTLGTGFGDCYQDKIVRYPKGEDTSPVLTEKSCAAFFPEVGFYRNAVNLGIKGIDTAFIYGTEEQIGREVPEAKLNAPDVFITTKSMTPAFRKMLGVLHGTDKMADQLRALQRRSVNVLYNHENSGNDDEWRLLEEEIHRGHARALGASGVHSALKQALCVKDGKCNMHVSAIQATISPCQHYAARHLQHTLDKQEWLGNVTFVGHSAFAFCEGEPIIKSIAKRLGRSVAAVALRVNLEQGIPMLVQTAKPEHLRQDLGVFDFELSPGDLSQILFNQRLYSTSSDLFEE